MGYTSVRLIEIRTKFNLIREKEWTGAPYLTNNGMVFPGRHTTSGRADTSRKESKEFSVDEQGLIILKDKMRH
jgi:hypothetical protein